MFASYTHTLQFLENLGLFRMDLTLERVEEALQALELTEPSFATVHVVGTNGKGSTATFLESIARAHGLRTGLYTSPHFVSPAERIRINGHMLQEHAWPTLASRVHAAAPQLTHFEFLTVLALLAFAEHQVDIAIVEAGLGGQGDATTACVRHMLCITSIDMDHEKILGSSIEQIALNKAHAMRHGMPVFSAPQKNIVWNILETVAQERGAKLQLASKEKCIHIENIQEAMTLQGAHQAENATLASVAWAGLCELFSFAYSEEKLQHGLMHAFIPGRFQYIEVEKEGLPRWCIVDGAHNLAGLQSLCKTVATLANCQKAPAAIVFSCFADKNMQAMAEQIRILRKHCCKPCPIFIPKQREKERAMNKIERETLALDIADSQGDVFIVENIVEALRLAQGLLQEQGQESHPVLVCGSLYLLGEFFSCVAPHALEINKHIL